MQYGIQKVLTMRGYDIVTDEPKITLKFLKETNFTVGQEQATLTQNGTAMLHFDHSQSLEITGNSATIDDGLLELQTGAALEVLTNTNEIRITEERTVDTNACTTTATATGTAGAELKFIEVLDVYGNITATYTQVAATPATTQFTYTPGTKTVTFFAGDLADDTTVRLHYFPTVASARKISQSGNASSATLRWEAEAVFKDVCTKEERLGFIVIYSGHISGAFNWNLAESAAPAVHNFTLMGEKLCNEKIWDAYFYDGTQVS